MTVMKTHVSWTDSSWNPTTGCTKVSAGCLHCYAEALTKRLGRGRDFAQVKMHRERLGDVKKFRAIKNKAGELRMRRVFVNSMSDLMHEDIPDEFRDLVFDRMEEQREAIFQILTKRPITLARYIDRRYPKQRVPFNIWLGVSCEDNRVKQRLRMLRMLKADHDFTAFVSVEPLIGPVTEHDYADLDWILIGGESRQGKDLQLMDVAWARDARDRARKAGASVWFKQFGDWINNPLYLKHKALAPSAKHIDLVGKAIGAGERQAFIEYPPGRSPIVGGEKGGATLDGEVLHEMPPLYHKMSELLNKQSLLA